MPPVRVKVNRTRSVALASVAVPTVEGDHALGHSRGG